MPRSVGVLGGGQLGLMLGEAATPLRIPVNFLDVPGAPAKQVFNHDGNVDGSFKNKGPIEKLAAKSDVITIEIEHVDTEILEQISATTEVQPSWRTIRTIQDKYLQKQHLQDHGVATAQSLALDAATLPELQRASETLGLPLMLKSRKDAYDGRGNYPVRTQKDFAPALEALGRNGKLYAEKWADFRMELAVMVVKTKDDVLTFPTTETIHENSICKLTYTPPRGISKAVSRKAQDLAKRAVSCFWGKGIFGVEMFLLKDDSLLINEIAPRPHNSGHYTIEACSVSQFSAHLSAILDLPLHQDDLELKEPAIMLNILGGAEPDSHERVYEEALNLRKRPGIHMYGKGEARPGRKMGHVTVTAPTMEEAQSLIKPLIDFVDRGKSSTTQSDESQHSQRNSTTDGRSNSKPSSAISPRVGHEDASPQVAVLMGSDTDLPIMSGACAILEQFAIPYTVRITSAHRTPDLMAQFAATAAGRGIKVIVAGAGGAAHLPGMVAAHTPLPVIGVPIKPSVGDGMDSLLSIVCMPHGTPVATVAVNKAGNAALLAAQILALADDRVRAEVVAFKDRAKRESSDKDRALAELGWEAYLDGMKKK